MIHSRSFRGGESERTNSRRRATGEQISRLRGERGKSLVAGEPTPVTLKSITSLVRPPVPTGRNTPSEVSQTLPI